MPHPYTVVQDDDGRRTLVVYLADGIGPVVAHGDHPNYHELIDAAESDDATASEVRELADLSLAVAAKFDRLSPRVSVGNGRVFFDGDELDDSLTRHIVRCLDDPSTGDWRPLVSFLENIANNPNAHSREQLYDWLRSHELSISQAGCIIGYKGVGQWGENEGQAGYLSGFQGTAIVDGTTVHGNIPYAVGSVVEMPRSAVQHDPGAACSTGLHVGTFGYAHSYASGAMLRVAVNPRDVVSVPTDAGGEKVRVSRLLVQAVIEAPETAPILYDEDEGDDDEGWL